MQTKLILILGLLLALAGCDQAIDIADRPNEEITNNDGPQTSVLHTGLSYELAETNQTQTSNFTVGVAEKIAFKQNALFYDQAGVKKSITLVNMVIGLKKALKLYNEDKDKDNAVKQAIIVRDMLEKTADELGQEDLQTEADLVSKLIENMKTYEPPVYENSCCDADGVGFGNSAPRIDAGVQAAPGDVTGGSFTGSGSVNAPAPSAGKTLGATPGGAQDIGLVRRWIEEGKVPSAANLTVQGLLSEHDLPIEGAECKQFLCIHGSLGVAPVLDQEDGTTFVQIGFSSGLRTDTFKRRPLNLVLVVDVSGSMRSGDKMSSTILALKTLVNKLNENDRLGIIRYNSTAVVHMESTPVTDKDAIKKSIEQLAAGGSTNTEAGLRMGFEMAENFLDEEGKNHRVMLFTDARPNVGKTNKESFIEIAQIFADKGIGLSSFGVGIDFKHELILGISQIRGGNYFYLQNAEKIAKVFDLDFDYMVTPLAYDMKITLESGDNYEIVEVYGIPDWNAEKQKITMDVKTLFLSRSKGAIMLRLKYTGPQYY